MGRPGRSWSAAERVYASQLISFAFKTETGDLVIVPQLPKRETYLVGEVSGAYTHIEPHPPSGPHRRSVRWLGEFDRRALSRPAVNTLGTIQTVFRPTKVEAELRNLLTDLRPWTGADTSPPVTLRPDAVKPANAAPTTPAPPVPSAPRVSANRQRFRCRWTSGSAPGGVSPSPTITRRSFMQQVPRHVDPESDWRDVPGVYVLTGTDLQQTTTRTGPERTLTMTSIVRPWAYVGLSEKFSDRMSSHRQSKQEWRRALVVRSGATPFSSDDIKYLEARVYAVLADTQEITLAQAVPNGNTSAQPRNPTFLDQCADAVVAVLRLTGTLI